MRSVAIKIMHTSSGREYVITAKLNYLGDSISLLEHKINEFFQEKYGKAYCMLYWYLI